MQSPSKKIDDDNLLLANFVGLDTLEKEELIPTGIYKDVSKIPFLQFDKSFDWLMVVVCQLYEANYSVIIQDGACMIQEENSMEPCIWNNCRKDISTKELREVVFNSCVEAVEEINVIETCEEINQIVKQLKAWNLEEEDVE